MPINLEAVRALRSALTGNILPVEADPNAKSNVIPFPISTKQETTPPPLSLYIPSTDRKYTPRKYQIEGINMFLDKKRAILWDAPGIGKTIQASEAANIHRPVVILAPTYLTYQWFDFLCEQYPETSICLVDGPRKEREAALAQHHDWYICNHEMMRSYTMPEWVNCLIIDEAHHFRNREPKQSKNLAAYAKKIPHVYMLTATPIYKTPDNLWMLFHIIDSKTYSSYWRFVEQHCRTYSTNYGAKVLGVKNSALLNAELALHGLGRGYKDVELELPKLITRHLSVIPNAAFIAEYNKVRTQFVYNDKDIRSLMEAMHIMRRMTAKTKLEHVLEFLQDEPEGIIFCWYKDTAEALATLLEIPCITGEIPPDKRKELAKERLVVGTIASISEGVDLSHLNHAIFFEGDYVPARIYQALSRVRRARLSSEPVRATYIYCKSTIDEVVFQAAQARNSTIQSVMRRALLEGNSE